MVNTNTEPMIMEDTLIMADGLNWVIPRKMILNNKLAHVATMPANNPDNTAFENSVCL